MRKVDWNSRYDDELNSWVRKEGMMYNLGMTDWAQEMCGSISSASYLVQPGELIESGDIICILESDKVTTEFIGPLSGRVVALNPSLSTDPGLINSDCYESGWIVKMEKCDQSLFDLLKDPIWYEDAIDSFFRKGS